MTDQPTPGPAAPERQPRRRRHYIFQGLVTLAILVATIFIARSLLETAPTADVRPPPERQARLVDVVELAAVDFQPTVTGWGTLQPSRELTLRAQVSGAVTARSPNLEPGMTVDQGDVLVQVDPTAYQAAVVQAESALAEAQANLALEQGQQAVAQREFELLADELGELGGSQGLILREPQLRMAQAAVDSARAGLTQARLELERTTLEAPFDALVTSRGVTTGAQVTPSTDIARLVGTDTWWLEVLLPAARLSWLEDPGTAPGGIPVTLRQPGVWGEDGQRQGYLLRVLSELEEQGRLARVLVAVPDPLATGDAETPRLLLGSFLQADIEGRTFHDVIVIEPEWLRENDTVWLMGQDDTLEIRPVNVLYRDDESVVISAGLKAGERIVTSRMSTPAEGMPLRTEARTHSVGAGPARAEGEPRDA